MKLSRKFQLLSNFVKHYIINRTGYIHTQNSTIQVTRRGSIYSPIKDLSTNKTDSDVKRGFWRPHCGPHNAIIGGVISPLLEAGM